MGKSTELFSESIKAGSRTYFFDVKESSDGVKYLVVSESRARKSGFEHNRVMVFQENFDSFMDGFQKMMDFVKNN